MQTSHSWTALSPPLPSHLILYTSSSYGRCPNPHCDREWGDCFLSPHSCTLFFLGHCVLSNPWVSLYNKPTSVLGTSAPTAPWGLSSSPSDTMDPDSLCMSTRHTSVFSISPMNPSSQKDRPNRLKVNRQRPLVRCLGEASWRFAGCRGG